MLKGAMAAEGKVGLMLNVRVADLDAVVAVLPALEKPTVSSLSDKAWVAVNTIVDESVVREIVPKLKDAGARGIVEYPINKIIE
jgi:ATP phosphoribosyltransferase